MKGSEKQIAWATEIQQTVIGILEEVIENYRAQDVPEDLKAAAIGRVSEIIEAIKSAKYAGSIINLFKDVRRTGNLPDDAGQITAIYKMRYPESVDEENILLKKATKFW